MRFRPVNNGTFEGDPSADSLFVSFDQVNFNFEYLLGRIILGGGRVDAVVAGPGI